MNERNFDAHAQGPEGGGPTPPPARKPRRWLKWLSFVMVAGITAFGALAAYVIVVVYPELPPVAVLGEYRPAQPLRIYSADNQLLAEYGIEKRIPLTYDQIPAHLRDALLATEDADFFAHGGVDFPGLIRASLANAMHGGKAQGGSTITMQLARNFFLTRKKTYARKLYEILLAIKIERTLSKPQILTLYMNQIYLGERAYGFGAAARVYYGKPVEALTLDECAMLAGLPKAPAAFNPIVDPARARTRQLYVLGRMLQAGVISREDFAAASAAPPFSPRVATGRDIPADAVTETVRQMIVKDYGDEAYELGLRVWTTVDTQRQRAAADAVLRGVEAYQARQPYPGAETRVPEDLRAQLDLRAGLTPALAAYLKQRPDYPGLSVGVVAHVDGAAKGANAGRATVLLEDGQHATVAQASAKQRVHLGDVVRVRTLANGTSQLSAMPTVQAALISISPEDGAILAMIGDNGMSGQHLNHATQAWRQPGSAFKPFLYAAAIAKGYGPSTQVFDLPLEIRPAPGAPIWRPKAGGAPLGELSLQTALAKSRNLVAIRLVQAIGPAYARDFAVQTFGFDKNKIPANLPMALGAGAVTPLQMAVGYAVFANGGERVAPYLVSRIVDSRGAELFHVRPERVRVMSPATSYLTSQMLREVVQHGTASATRVLGRSDIGGKTGTTNDYRDGWFAGFQPSAATVVWMGHDTPRSLGRSEWASRTALPVWIDYMKQALDGVPQATITVPDDITVADDVAYDKAFRPGNGFVEKLSPDGVAVSQPAGGDEDESDDAGAATAAAAGSTNGQKRGAPSDATAAKSERDRILQYFINE